MLIASSGVKPAGRAVSEREGDTNSNWCSLPTAVYSLYGSVQLVIDITVINLMKEL